MAIIKISDELLYQVIKDKLLLPGNIADLKRIDVNTFGIEVNLPDFQPDDVVIPRYQRYPDGNLYMLVGIEKDGD